MVDGVSTSTNPQVQDSAADKARTQLSGDFDTFLLLLTTQLKNQDPIEPLDTHEFTAQLVQFANVEQAIATNENLEKMLSNQAGTQINNAVNYIGKFVQAKGDGGRLQGGVAAFSYNLPTLATDVEISITDSLGQVVFTGPGPSDLGKNDVLWDGVNSFDGKDMEDGVYHIAVVAKDANGEKIEAETFATGFVTSVNLEDGEPILMIGDLDVSLDKVLSVRDPSDFATN